LPLATALGAVHAGKQQEVWCREVHRCLTYIGVGEDRILVKLRRVTQTVNVFRFR
jgi:hypothetical protein